MNIQNFPKDIIVQIFSFLPDVGSKDISNFCSTNKKFKLVTSEDRFWERFIPKKNIPADMSLKEFVLKRTIGSEKGLINCIKNFISNIKADENNVFQCCFTISDEIFLNVPLKNPSIKLAILFPKLNVETKFHTFVFRNEFAPSCLVEEEERQLTNLRVNFSYFPFKALPPYLEIIHEKIHELISKFDKSNNNKKLKSAEELIKEKYPVEYELLASRLTDTSAEYDELHSFAQLKLLELDQNILQLQV